MVGRKIWKYRFFILPPLHGVVRKESFRIGPYVGRCVIIIGRLVVMKGWN